MKSRLSPHQAASDINTMLNAIFGNNAERYPINMKQVALEISKAKYPEEPVTLVEGNDFDGFEGALLKDSDGKKGWAIFYKKNVTEGRMNFTIAHEFGHYMMHRQEYPEGMHCKSYDMVNRYHQIEKEANEFAANVLMPFDDLRKQISPKDKPSFEEIGNCSNRYQTSITATAIQWLKITERRAMLVLHRDDFIMWAQSSDSARKSGLYKKTANLSPQEIPQETVDALKEKRVEIFHDEGVWMPEPCQEMILRSDQYDFTVSLLHFEDKEIENEFGEEGDVEDLRDIVRNNHNI